MNGKKNFKCQSNCFLPYVKNVLSVCITMYYLSDKGRFKKTANALGITKNTLSMIIQRVTKAILNHLAEKYIKLPRREEEVNQSCSLFFEKHSLPQFLGAVDGAQIVIKWPSEKSTDYINRKGRYSLNIQTVADLSIAKWPGSVHDVQIFSNSSINTKLRNGSIPKCEKAIVQNEPLVTLCILRDPV